MRRLFIISFFAIIALVSSNVYARDLAVMLYVDDRAAGDAIYENYTKQVNLSRNLYPKGPGNFEFHVTIGYIKDVAREDIEALKLYIHQGMDKKIDHKEFHFGAVSLLGKATPFIVALANNPEDFQETNLELNNLLEQFKHGKYEMDKMSLPANYIPHLSLNGQLNRNVTLNNLPRILLKLNQIMQGVKISVTKLEIL